MEMSGKAWQATCSLSYTSERKRSMVLPYQ